MSKRATVDIIDASIPLPDEFDRWRKYPDAVRFKAYMRSFSTDPVLWHRHTPDEWAFDLTWNEYRYAEVISPAQVDTTIGSDDPGLYMFYVRPERTLCSFPRFPFYVGISNERNSNRSLRDRLKDYLPTHITQRLKRDNIDQMLQMYYGVLWVAYALAPRPGAELAELEKKLHGFVYPCYNRRDFPGDILTQRRRFDA